MADNYYTIKTFYRTDDVNEALIKEKSGFFSLFNPIEKKGNDTQFMAKEYDYQSRNVSNMGSLIEGTFKLRIYKYGKEVYKFMVDGWTFYSVFNANVLLDNFRIYNNKCEFECEDPNGRKVFVKFEVGGCSFIKALWVTIRYIITKENPTDIPSHFEMPESYLENYFYSHYSF